MLSERPAPDDGIWGRCRRSPVVMLATGLLVVLVTLALLAPLITPYDPTDLAQVSLADARLPPAWVAGGDARFPLGTDEQGRDLLSMILYGLRISLAVGCASVCLAAVLGVGLGLVAGYAGGLVDAVIMRLADVQMTFPAILIALLVDGVATAMTAPEHRETTAIAVLIVAIGLSIWVQFARTVRAVTRVECEKEYVAAARLVGRTRLAILACHILPNVMGPVIVLATLNLALAILTEATLSFLGVGAPPLTPSLGTLIRTGNDFLFSGEWWLALMPALALTALVVAINVLGDWLRRAADPTLRWVGR